MKNRLLTLFTTLMVTALTMVVFSTQAIASSGSKSLIIYYSLSGNTKMVAETLQQLISADIFEIKTLQPYPSDFHAVVEQAREERRTNFLPPIQPMTYDLKNYDIIYLGFPIWGNTIPQPLATFLSQNNLTGKTIIPFCTHDGYGIGQSFQVIAKYCPNAKILAGFNMLGADARKAKDLLTAWLGQIGINPTVSSKSSATVQETPITITISNTVLTGILHNNPVAEEFKTRLPVTIEMGQFGGREFYGSIARRIVTNIEGKLSFDNGELTYCPQNNTVAIFYAQTARPNLTMRVISMGKVTSDLTIFHTMQRNIPMTFSLKE